MLFKGTLISSQLSVYTLLKCKLFVKSILFFTMTLGKYLKLYYSKIVRFALKYVNLQFERGSPISDLKPSNSCFFSQIQENFVG